MNYTLQLLTGINLELYNGINLELKLRMYTLKFEFYLDLNLELILF